MPAIGPALCLRGHGYRSFVTGLQTYVRQACYGTDFISSEVLTMRIAKQDIPERINAPGAIARQKTEFGDATGYGKISCEYFSLGAGTDIAPLLQGLEGDLCQSPHWGYIIKGEVTVSFADGEHETTSGGDLFYWPPGHTVKVGKDADVVLFSPQHEHSIVIDHMRRKMGN